MQYRNYLATLTRVCGHTSEHPFAVRVGREMPDFDAVEGEILVVEPIDKEAKIEFMDEFIYRYPGPHGLHGNTLAPRTYNGV